MTPIAKTYAARQANLVGAVGETRRVIGAVCKYNHVPRIGEKRHCPRDIKTVIRFFCFARPIKGPPIRCQVETFGAFPVLDVRILNDAQPTVFRTRARQVEPFARWPQSTIQYVTGVLRRLRRKPAPVGVPSTRRIARHPNDGGRSMNCQLIRTKQDAGGFA